MVAETWNTFVVAEEVTDMLGMATWNIHVAEEVTDMLEIVA